MKKRLLLILMAAFVCGFVGCEGYEPQKVAEYSQAAAQISKELTELSEQIEPLITELAETGMLNEEKYNKLESLIAKATEIKGYAEEVALALGEYDYQNTGFVGVLETVSAINKGSSSFNPYASLIGIGLAIATAISTVFAGKNSNRAQALRRALIEVVAGIEQYKKNAADAKEIKQTLFSAQSAETANEVAQIRRDLDA